jgi:hypothetical protein
MIKNKDMKLIQAVANCIFKAITMSFAVLSYDDSARWIIFLAVFVALASEIDNFIEN